MTKFLLSVHVVVAIVAIGPVTVAASMFPRAARSSALPVVRTLHRICRVYAGLGVLVPVFGLATALSMGVLGDAWLLASIALTAVAAAVLVAAVLPDQRKVLDALETAPDTDISAWVRRIAMTGGVFNVLWATVTVLMIVRPGSTTGA
ncbi:membrane protein [Allokutzneria albata]|uniref:Uncharacterized protein n=1 Tax=Allokutzneria albata TaxID=211114 RepID=A0A1G9RY78_ALLAB|nr:membrane protein [Allokutzneria albata]SDM28114.1 hypothetical protein SAMN04489726_0767 [Allokutzneria albata]